MGGDRVLTMAAALHTCASLPRHSSVMVVAQLYLDGNSIGDAGISTVVGALAANDVLTRVCDGVAQRCGLHMRVCVCHTLIGFAQLDLGKSYDGYHRCNTLSEAGARALVRVLGAARARQELVVCP